MKMPKITKLLSVALALAVTTSGVLAAGTQTQNQTKSATANYELNLDTYFDIELKTNASVTSLNYSEGEYFIGFCVSSGCYEYEYKQIFCPLCSAYQNHHI